MRLSGYVKVVLMAGAALYLQQCAAVKPYERGYLASQIMDFNQCADEEAMDRHWQEIREGSSGGIGGSGGGCACN